VCKMENRFDIMTIAHAICVAGYVAITLGYVALYDLGRSCEEVRSEAMIAAILIAAMVAVDFLGKKLGNAK
jgi:Kef-type K+ transport system membrane component KefB